MSRKKIRWFEWGDEKPGYVTTWTVGEIARLRDCERWKGLRPLTCFSLLITHFNS